MVSKLKNIFRSILKVGKKNTDPFDKPIKKIKKIISRLEKIKEFTESQSYYVKFKIKGKSGDTYYRTKFFTVFSYFNRIKKGLKAVSRDLNNINLALTEISSEYELSVSKEKIAGIILKIDSLEEYAYKVLNYIASVRETFREMIKDKQLRDDSFCFKTRRFGSFCMSMLPIYSFN